MPSDRGEQRLSLFNERFKTLGGIASPLGFFGLALLIVEGFLMGAGRLFDLPVEFRVTMIWVGVALFVLLVTVVVLLVIFFPKNLVFTERSHVEFEAMQCWANSGAPLTGEELDSLPPTKAAPPERQLPPPTSP